LLTHHLLTHHFRVIVQIEINIPDHLTPPHDEIENVRLLLQKEMAEKGTAATTVVSGW